VRYARCCKQCLAKHQGDQKAFQYHTIMDTCDFCGDAPESEILFTLYPAEVPR
jgi:hypothetical protein